MFRHEGLLTFVGRLSRDREFCEWFAAQPSKALASHGLTDRDLRDLAMVVETEHHHRELATALQPAVQAMLALLDADARGEIGEPAERLAHLDAELQATRERLAVARARSPRPWWKFW